MKAISAAIIALSGAVTVAGGVSVPNYVVGSFAMLVGYGLLVVALVAWAVTMSRGGDKN